MTTWIVEVFFEGDWWPSLDCIPHDSRDEARKGLAFLRACGATNKYRIRKYVRAD